MINTKLQNIIDTKSAIGNAIVNKGGTITSETPFFNYAAQIDGISTGTPQTIFQASDGSKWALTNAVNLTNVSNNVTSDFNYWQPANNSTSDPILNIGTFGANISGNIQLVPVNQVNISQYVNIVATDIDGAKYEGFNGFDQITNPTPTGNTTFNQWLLNNSATGTVIFANATFTTGIYNGPNAALNQANMAFINNTANYGGTIRSVATNNGFIYVVGSTNQRVQKFHESNLVFNNSTADYGGAIQSVTTNNGFIYVGGINSTNSVINSRIQKFHESNLAFVGNTANYGGDIRSIATNNGFIYVVGSNGPNATTQIQSTIKKYNESTLALNGTAPVVYESTIASIYINNGFVYIGGSVRTGVNRGVTKYHESNLALVGANLNASSTPNYGGDIRSIATNNGFIYAGGATDNRVQRFNESTLEFVDNTTSYGATIGRIATNNGFIYAGGGGNDIANRDVKKYYESNLAFVGNTNSYGGFILEISINNGHIYVGGDTDQTIKKFAELDEVKDNQTFYTATKIKE
jgi:hypothetical protein